jgi:hypothetical protein
MYNSRSWNAFKAHVTRKHKCQAKADNAMQFYNDNTSDEDNEIDSDNEDINITEKHKWFTASYLLQLETNHKLSQNALNDVVSSTKIYLSQSLDLFKSEVKQHLQDEGMACNFLEHVSTPNSLDDFSSPHLRNKYFKEKCRLLAPAVVLLGRKVTRKKGKLGHVDHLGYIVPFVRNLEEFLNMPEVWNFVSNPHTRDETIMGDLCDGEFIKIHPLFKRNKSALQIIVSQDDFEIANPLGSHAKKHKIAIFYFTLGNIPPQYRSRMPAVQLLAVAKTTDMKIFGAKKLLKDFISTINLLQTGGITMDIMGEQINIEGSLVMCPCDTLASQWLGGFKESCSFAKKACRTCNAGLIERTTIFDSSHFITRGMEEHKERCQHLDTLSKGARKYWSKMWGINKTSPLMDITGIDLASILVHEPMHILLEGIVPYEMALLLHSLICVEKMFSISWLNENIQNYPYSSVDISRKPVVIERKHLVVDVKIKQSSSAMLTLCYILPLILALKVDESKEKYLNFIRLLQITQLCTSPYASRDTAGQLQQLVMEHNESFQIEYPKNSTIPKMHFLVHMVQQVVQFGPLRHQWCMRFEAKHGFFKNFTWKCFKNLPYSIAEKHQRWMCRQMMGNSEGKRSTTFMYAGDSVSEGQIVQFGEFYPELTLEMVELCHLLVPIIQQPLMAYKTNTITIHGQMYKTGFAVLYDNEDEDPKFARIQDIFVVEHAKFLVAEKLETRHFSTKHNAFVVSAQATYMIIKPTTLKNTWPLPIHMVNGQLFIVNRYSHVAQFV